MASADFLPRHHKKAEWFSDLYKAHIKIGCHSLTPGFVDHITSCQRPGDVSVHDMEPLHRSGEHLRA